MKNISVVKSTKDEKSTELIVTLAELGVGSDALDFLSDHYEALAKDLMNAECSTLLKDVRESQRTLKHFKRKINAAQKWLVRDEFK